MFLTIFFLDSIFEPLLKENNTKLNQIIVTVGQIQQRWLELTLVLDPNKNHLIANFYKTPTFVKICSLSSGSLEPVQYQVNEDFYCAW